MPTYEGLQHGMSVSDSVPVDELARNLNICTDARSSMKRPVVLVLGPHRAAVSGVSTHLNTLFASRLAEDFSLIHFQVGSEGRRENVPQKLLRLAASPFQLGLLLLETGAGVVHINTSLDRGGYWRDLIYWIVVKALGRRVVNQIHGGALPQEFFGGNALLTWILRRFLVSSSVVAVLATAELRAYRDFDRRINVHLVPNAIDVAGLADQNRVYNTTRPLRLVYVGRLVRSKGLFEVIEALAKLKRGGREFTLSVAGEGPDRAALTAASQRAGLEDRVQFLGSIFAAGKCRLWLESDLFVFPTYHKEGLPYSLLEAMAAGCVPITTRVAAMPDVIRDGEHGLFVPVKDADALAGAVAALDDDRERLTHMSGAARRRVLEHYAVARLADDFRRLYDRCLA